MHPVSLCLHIIADALGLRFNRLEQLARIMMEQGLLPIASGRAVPQIGPDKFLALIAAAAHADRIIDAPVIANAFHDLPERAGGRSGTPTFGRFWDAIMADERPDAIQIDFVRVFDAHQRCKFAARVQINGELDFTFSEPLPANSVRELAFRITPRAFKELRERFGLWQPVIAREFAP